MVQLDGLRGIAAFMVAFYHMDIVYGINGPFQRGYLFVDLFFLLSGFVLAVSTEKKIRAGIGAIEFTWVRYKRLLPLVAVGAGVAVVRALYIGMADPLTLALWLALDLAMVPSFAGMGPFYRYNGPQWTLFYELVANFLHAAVLHRVATRWVLVLAGAMALWLVHEVQVHGSDTMGVNAPTWTTWWSALPRVGWSYVLGVWIGRKYLEGARGPAMPWWLAPGDRHCAGASSSARKGLGRSGFRDPVPARNDVGGGHGQSTGRHAPGHGMARQLLAAALLRPPDRARLDQGAGRQSQFADGRNGPRNRAGLVVVLFEGCILRQPASAAKSSFEFLIPRKSRASPED
jgi:hypothetical protein